MVRAVFLDHHYVCSRMAVRHSTCRIILWYLLTVLYVTRVVVPVHPWMPFNELSHITFLSRLAHNILLQNCSNKICRELFIPDMWLAAADCRVWSLLKKRRRWLRSLVTFSHSHNSFEVRVQDVSSCVARKRLYTGVEKAGGLFILNEIWKKIFY